MSGRVYGPELAWIDGVFERDQSISIEGGEIIAIGRDAVTDPLPGIAMIPGFVSTHSHAFQRALRGQGEVFPTGSDSFWGWREAMYGLVESLDRPQLHAACVRAFREMRQAGITCVGEFHYLHHVDGDPFAADEVVLEAAAEVGIRIVLLETCYMCGGIDTPLSPAQAHFETTDLAAFWSQVDALRAAVDGCMQRVGIAAHSIRAVPPESLLTVASEAARRGLPLHLHLEEQRQEIDGCIERYGMTPMALVCQEVTVSPMLTAVHCTHTSAADLEQWLDDGGNVCVCPLTEANLGDGRCDLARIVRHPGSLSIGTDSNARIGMLEEMRWLEYGQRLGREARGIATDADGRMDRVLMDAATSGGARALGMSVGRIATGRLADFALIDLADPQVAGVADEDLAAAPCCGGDNSVIAGTIVNGASPVVRGAT